MLTSEHFFLKMEYPGMRSPYGEKTRVFHLWVQRRTKVDGEALSAGRKWAMVFTDYRDPLSIEEHGGKKYIKNALLSAEGTPRYLSWSGGYTTLSAGRKWATWSSERDTAVQFVQEGDTAQIIGEFGGREYALDYTGTFSTDDFAYNLVWHTNARSNKCRWRAYYVVKEGALVINSPEDHNMVMGLSEREPEFKACGGQPHNSYCPSWSTCKSVRNATHYHSCVTNRWGGKFKFGKKKGLDFTPDKISTVYFIAQLSDQNTGYIIRDNGKYILALSNDREFDDYKELKPVRELNWTYISYVWPASVRLATGDLKVIDSALTQKTETDEKGQTQIRFEHFMFGTLTPWTLQSVPSVNAAVVFNKNWNRTLPFARWATDSEIDEIKRVKSALEVAGTRSGLGKTTKSLTDCVGRTNHKSKSWYGDPTDVSKCDVFMTRFCQDMADHPYCACFVKGEKLKEEVGALAEHVPKASAYCMLERCWSKNEAYKTENMKENSSCPTSYNICINTLGAENIEKAEFNKITMVNNCKTETTMKKENEKPEALIADRPDGGTSVSEETQPTDEPHPEQTDSSAVAQGSFFANVGRTSGFQGAGDSSGGGADIGMIVGIAVAVILLAVIAYFALRPKGEEQPQMFVPAQPQPPQFVGPAQPQPPQFVGPAQALQNYAPGLTSTATYIGA